MNRSLDIDVRAGRHYDSKLPLVPGIDPSSQVAALGEGVDALKVGDRVGVTGSTVPCLECSSCLAGRQEQCTNRAWLGRHVWGGYAEFVRVPVRNLIKLPPEVSFAEATAVLRHVPTAISLIDRSALQSGESCIVMGAAGALGSFLVQLAKMAGATVIAAAGSDARVEAARWLGADFGVNYRAEDLEQDVGRKTDGRGVDVVFEKIGDPTLWPGAFNSLARGGRLVIIGAHGGTGVQLDVRRLYKQRLSILGFGRPIEQVDYQHAIELAAAGKLKCMIDRILPLRDARIAHEAVERSEALGKVILDPTLT